MYEDLRHYCLLLLLGIALVSVPGPPVAASDARPEGERVLADFAAGSNGPAWHVVNDNVMGGRSEGDFRRADGELRFAGRTNTDGGGFSSIRTEELELDLSAYEGVRLRVRGDGRRYTWRLTTNARWRGTPIGYWADFETDVDSWTTVDIPFARFVPQVRGTRLAGPPLDLARITGMGLMIYDGEDGPFDLRLAEVAAYPAEAAFDFGRYRWEKRVLVVNAATATETALEALRAEIAASADAFSDRDMVLVTLTDDTPSQAAGRTLTAAEVASARRTLNLRPGAFAVRLIGKDGTVKLARDAATSLAEIYALIDTMPMRRNEMTDRD